MSRTIDERVVQMRFDNKQFESGVAETIKTLNKLDDSLTLTDSAKGLVELGKAAKKVDLSKLEDSATAVEMKFSAMSIAAMTSISKLVSYVEDAAAKMLKDLTIAPVTSGFDKYTQKTEAVQTIMNATGMAVEEVTARLEKLQWFTDETSYSFTDMVNNISKFTSQGVKLDTALSAMEGIALAAADAGVSTTKAGSAMEALSKSLGKGYVELLRWSQLGTINMDTTKFKNVIMQTAEEMGTLIKTTNGYKTAVKGTEVTISSFSNTLSEKWLTSDVLIASLNKYSEYADKLYDLQEVGESCADAMERLGDMNLELAAGAFKAGQQAKTFTDAVNAVKDAVSSGWMESFEIIFGNFNESVELWTDFTNALWDIFAAGAEGRNDLLRGGLMSGWNQFIREGINNVEDYKAKILEVARTQEIAVDDMIESAGSFEKSLSKGWLSADILGKSIDKLVDSFDGLSYAELANRGYSKDAVDGLINLKAAVEAGTVSLEDFADMIAKPSGRENLIASVSNAFEALMSIVEPVKQAIRDLFPPVTSEQLYAFTEGLRTFTEQLKLSDEAAFTLMVIAKLLLLPLKAIAVVAQIAGAGILVLISIIFSLINSFLAMFALGNPIADFFKKTLGDERYQKAGEALSKIVERLGNAFAAFKDKISSVVSYLKDSELFTRGFRALYDILAPIVEFLLDAFVAGLEFIANLDFRKVIDYINGGIAFLREGLQNIIDLLPNVGKAVSDLFSQFEYKSPIGILKSIKNVLNEIVTSAATFAKDIALASFMEYVSEKGAALKETLDRIVNAMLSFIQVLNPTKILVLGFGVAFAKILFTISDAISAIAKFTKSATGVLDGISGVLKEWKKSLQPNYFMQFAIAVGVLAGSLMLLTMLDTDKLIKSALALGMLIGVFSAVLLLFALLNEFLFKSKTFAANMSAIGLAMIEMAGAIALLSASLIMISKVDTSNIASQLVVLGILVTTLSVITVFLSKHAKELTSGSLFLIAFALSLGAILKSLEKITDANLPGLNAKILTMVVIMTSLSLLALSAKNVKWTGAAGIALLATDLLILVSVLKRLGDVNPQTVARNIDTFIGLMGAITVLALASRLAGKNSAGAGIAIVLMTSSLLIIVQAMKQIAALPEDVIQKGTETIVSILAMFAILTAVTVFSGANALKVGVAIIQMSTAVLLLSLAIEWIGGLDEDQVRKGTGAVVALLGFFGAVIGLSKLAEKSTASIVALGGVIGVITAALAIMMLIPVGDIIIAAEGLGLAIVSVGVAMGLMSKLQFKSVISTTLLLGVFLYGMYQNFKILDGISWEASLSAAIGMGVVIIAFAAAVNNMAKIDFKKLNAKSLGLLAANVGLMGLVMAEIAWLLSLMNGIDWANAIAGSVALVIALNGFSSAIWILSTMKGSPELSLKNAGIMALIMGEVALIFWALNGLNPQTMMTTALALSVALGAFSVSMAILGGIGKSVDLPATLISAGILVVIGALLMPLFETLNNLDPGVMLATSLSLSIALIAFSGAMALLAFAGTLAVTAIPGLIAIGVTAGVVAVVIGILGKILRNPDAKEVVENGVWFFGQLGAAIGGFIGNIIGGIAGGLATGGLPVVADNLAQFGEKIGPFIEALNQIDESASRGAINLADMVMTFTQAKFLDAIDIFGGSSSPLEVFGQQLEDFAPHIVAFCQKISEVTPAQLEAATNAGLAMSEFANSIPKSGGVIQDFLGTQDMGVFGNQLEALGKGLVAYQNAFEGVDFDAELVTSSANAAMALTELNNKLPGSGGKLQEFLGEQNLSTFAGQLEDLAFGIVAYHNVIKDANINDKIITSSANAALALAELNNKLPGAGGKMQEFFGSQNLSDWGSQIAAFATGFVAYYKTISSEKIDKGIVEKSIAVVDSLVAMNNNLPTSGGIFAWFFGAQDIGKFGTDLQAMGEGISSFYSSISSFSGDTAGTETALQNVVNAVEIIADADPSKGGFLGIGGTNLEEFGKGLSTFSDGLRAFYDIITSFKNIETDPIASLNARGQELGQALVDGFKAKYNDAKDAGAYLVQGIADGIKEHADAVSKEVYAAARDIGGNLVDAILGTVESRKNESKTSIEGLGNTLIQAMRNTLGIRSPSKVFETIGGQIVDGLKKGITGNTSSATSGIVKMGGELVKAIKSTLEIHSPSRVMRDEVGRYIVQGVAEGITTDTSAEDAAEKMAQNLVKIFKTELDNINIDVNTADLEYKLWSALTPDASVADMYEHQNELLTKKLEAQAERVRVANAEYLATVEALGENSTYAAEARNKLLNEQITMADLANEYMDLQESMSASVRDMLDADLANAQAEYDLWETLNQNAPQQERYLKKSELLATQLKAQAEVVAQAEDSYVKIVAEYGESSLEAAQARNNLLNEQKSMAQIASDLIDLDKEIQEKLRESLDLRVDNAEQEYDLWTKLNTSATEEEKYLKKQEVLSTQLSAQAEVVAKASEDYVKATETYGEGSVESAKAFNNLLTEQNKMADLATSLAEMQAHSATVLDSTIADLEYKVWSKLNANATDEEKYEKQVENISNRLEIAAQKVVNAEAIWKQAIDIYGEGSQEARNARAEYLQAQSDMLDIAEELSEARITQAEKQQEYITQQEQARRDYVEYVKKYGDSMNAVVEQGLATREEVLAAAREAVGLDSTDVYKEKIAAFAETTDVKEIVEEYMGRTTDAFVDEAKGTDVSEIVDAYMGNVTGELSQGAKDADVSDVVNSYMENVDGALISNAESRDVSGLVDALVGNLDDTEVRLSIEIADAVSKGVSSGVASASESVTASGAKIGTDLTSGLGKVDVAKQIEEAVKGITGSFDSGLTSVDFSNSAAGILNGLLDGISSKLGSFKDLGKNLFSSLFDAFNNFAGIHSPSTKMYESGEYLVDGLNNGIIQNGSGSKSAMESLMNACLSGTNGYYPKWEQAGSYIVDGISSGIKANTYRAAEAAAEMAAQTYAAAMAQLDINSPSKAFMELGMYSDMGFAKGLLEYSALASDASEAVGEETLEELSAVIARIARSIESDMDFQPTIRPVIDMSDVEAGARQMNELFGKRSFALSTSIQQASAISSAMRMLGAKVSSTGNSEDANSNPVTNNYFTQNNYSPKALNRQEIYRQTRSQFAQFKRRDNS